MFLASWERKGKGLRRGNEVNTEIETQCCLKSYFPRNLDSEQMLSKQCSTESRKMMNYSWATRERFEMPRDVLSWFWFWCCRHLGLCLANPNEQLLWLQQKESWKWCNGMMLSASKRAITLPFELSDSSAKMQIPGFCYSKSRRSNKSLCWVQRGTSWGWQWPQAEEETTASQACSPC